MPYRLQLEFLVLILHLPHSVDVGRERQRGGVVVEAVESVLGIERLHLVGLGVPSPIGLLEVPAFGVVDRRGDVEVVEHVERRLHGYAVLHAVAHVVERLPREDVLLRGVHRVGDLARVAHRDLFIPAVLAQFHRAFEGEELRYVERYVGQRDRYRLRLRVLRHGHVHREREGRARPVLRVRYRRVGLRREHVVEVGRRIFAVTARRQVHRGREGRSRVCLGILSVGPLQLVGVLLYEVGVALVARTDAGEVEIQVARIFVSLYVARSGVHLPRPECVDSARQGEVHVLAEGEVVTEAAHEESSARLLAVRGHQDSRFRSRAEREKRLGQAEERYVDILYDQMARAHDGLFARNDLYLRRAVIEMRMVRLVAGSVHAARDVDGVVLHLLHVLAHEPSVALLGGYVLDLGALALDVVGDGVHVERGGVLRELGAGYDGLSVHRVGLAVRVYVLAVEVDVHEVGLQRHVVVRHLAFLVQIDHLAAQVVIERVGGASRDGVVEALLASAGGVAPRLGEGVRVAFRGYRI